MFWLSSRIARASIIEHIIWCKISDRIAESISGLTSCHMNMLDMTIDMNEYVSRWKPTRLLFCFCLRVHFFLAVFCSLLGFHLKWNSNGYHFALQFSSSKEERGKELWRICKKNNIFYIWVKKSIWMTFHKT